MKNNSGTLLIAILAGAAVGASLGILYAPNKGSKTRGKIKHAVTDTTEEVTEWVKNAKEDLVRSAHDNKVAFDKKIESSISTMSTKAEDIISSLEHKLETIKNTNLKFKS